MKPGVKEALRTVADREHGSIANMEEVLMWDFCGWNGIAIPKEGELFGDGTEADLDSERVR